MNVKGEVLLKRNGGTLPARKGIKLQEKDVIQTIGKSKAQLRFSDNTLVSIGSDSDFNVEEYLYEPEQNSGTTRFTVAAGAFKMITGRIAKLAPKHFKIKMEQQL